MGPKMPSSFILCVTLQCQFLVLKLVDSFVFSYVLLLLSTVLWNRFVIYHFRGIIS